MITKRNYNQPTCIYETWHCNGRLYIMCIEPDWIFDEKKDEFQQADLIIGFTHNYEEDKAHVFLGSEKVINLIKYLKHNNTSFGAKQIPSLKTLAIMLHNDKQIEDIKTYCQTIHGKCEYDPNREDIVSMLLDEMIENGLLPPRGNVHGEDVAGLA